MERAYSRCRWHTNRRGRLFTTMSGLSLSQSIPWESIPWDRRVLVKSGGARLEDPHGDTVSLSEAWRPITRFACGLEDALRKPPWAGSPPSHTDLSTRFTYAPTNEPPWPRLLSSTGRRRAEVDGLRGLTAPVSNTRSPALSCALSCRRGCLVSPDGLEPAINGL